MIIATRKLPMGICFAWRPVWTASGMVWLEFVRYKWNEGWGWGSDGHYTYQRLLASDIVYDRGGLVDQAQPVQTQNERAAMEMYE